MATYPSFITRIGTIFSWGFSCLKSMAEYFLDLFLQLAVQQCCTILADVFSWECTQKICVFATGGETVTSAYGNDMCIP